MFLQEGNYEQKILPWFQRFLKTILQTFMKQLDSIRNFDGKYTDATSVQITKVAKQRNR